MTVLTTLELAGNHPDNTLINATEQEDGKFSSFCHILRNGEIHKLLLSTKPVFDSEQEAIDKMTELIEDVIKKV